MSNQLKKLHIKNFRSLANVTINTSSLNILFGPNGAGKSTFLDTIWFAHDCAIRGVDNASSFREHGIGILWDGASGPVEATQEIREENISIKIETEKASYEISFGFSSGRIESFVGEKLILKREESSSSELSHLREVSEEITLINRRIGSDKAAFYNFQTGQMEWLTLREPEKLALTRYVLFENCPPEALELENLLRQVRSYHLRAASLYHLRRYGSELDSGERLQERCENLWSVLRNLYDRRVVDLRYDTIMGFMKESFPDFEGLLFEQTGRNTVYANFLNKKRRQPIQASGVSDGHLQMLINLTALFSENQNRYSLILLDEPEISLHPWALAILASAIKLSTQEWNRQVFIATHSPVLISQFEPENILASQLDETGQTVMQRVSEMAEIQDLLSEYATGSLYMAEMIAPQSKSQQLEIYR